MGTASDGTARRTRTPPPWHVPNSCHLYTSSNPRRSWTSLALSPFYHLISSPQMDILGALPHHCFRTFVTAGRDWRRRGAVLHRLGRFLSACSRQGPQGGGCGGPGRGFQEVGHVPFDLHITCLHLLLPSTNRNLLQVFSSDALRLSYTDAKALMMK
jgi:hypothetical protein